jgi:hypothetical protein
MAEVVIFDGRNPIYRKYISRLHLPPVTGVPWRTAGRSAKEQRERCSIHLHNLRVTHSIWDISFTVPVRVCLGNDP